ncbi:putative ribosomal protein L10P [Medicago truncatula]|uniref:Putative ribosomal protein L10P n=1 Tax=Medicago truncatula TaxID=3880 RepID=A0A072UU58_MEDTR|nr:ribosomal protein L10 family protein [Medicago truncatula]RHN64926.1 putative ribosomal protein L10P [Medicago truncatula]
MEATATLLSFSLPSTKTQSFQILTRPINPFNPPTSYKHRPISKTHRLSINAAISRTKKEETVETVKEQLENCYLLAGINYKGFTVKQFQELRKTLPETTKLVVAKNTLVYKALEGTQWETLKPCMTGKFYGPDEFKKLETLPTRGEIYANLLGSLKSPSSALVTTIQAPARELIMVLKAHIKKLEEQEQGSAVL